MLRCLLFLAFVFTAHFVNAQKISLTELQKLMDYDHFRIDTTLKKKGYLLMQKDVDSASSLYQYSHVDHKEDEKKEGKPTTIRSIQYMDVNTEKYSSRLLTYRTYDKDEYSEIAMSLLNNHFKCTEKYSFQGAENLVYNNGAQTIRIKIFTAPLSDGRRFTAYELELGK